MNPEVAKILEMMVKGLVPNNWENNFVAVYDIAGNRYTVKFDENYDIAEIDVVVID